MYILVMEMSLIAWNMSECMRLNSIRLELALFTMQKNGKRHLLPAFWKVREKKPKLLTVST